MGEIKAAKAAFGHRKINHAEHAMVHQDVLGTEVGMHRHGIQIGRLETGRAGLELGEDLAATSRTETWSLLEFEPPESYVNVFPQLVDRKPLGLGWRLLVGPQPLSGERSGPRRFL